MTVDSNHASRARLAFSGNDKGKGNCKSDAGSVGNTQKNQIGNEADMRPEVVAGEETIVCFKVEGKAGGLVEFRSCLWKKVEKLC